MTHSGIVRKIIRAINEEIEPYWKLSPLPPNLPISRRLVLSDTIHVWCQHSTCVVSTKHMYGIHTCMMWTQHMCGVRKTHTTCKSHFCVMSKYVALFVAQVAICLGTPWGWFGMVWKNVHIRLESMISQIVRKYFPCNGVLKSIALSIFLDWKALNFEQILLY